MPRQGSNPKRRIGLPGRLNVEARQRLVARLQYVGSALHKSKPGNYGFLPPVNPRPHKSICDGRRDLLLEEAQALFRAGILCGMMSEPDREGVPKYVWSVDDHGEAYEAKISAGSLTYHGYRLEEEDSMRRVVLKEWKQRCPAN